MLGQRAGPEGAEGDLKTELAVGADERRGENLAEGDAVGKIFCEPEMEGLKGELGAALMGRAAC